MKITFSVEIVKDDRMLIAATAESGEKASIWCVPNDKQQEIRTVSSSTESFLSNILKALAEPSVIIDTFTGENPVEKLDGLEVEVSWP